VNKSRIAAALKAVPGTRGSIAPQANGLGRISPIQSEMYYNNPYRNTYGPFLPRQPEIFSDGAFGPMPPIQPVPIDQPPAGGQFPDPRWWQYTQGWNLPTPPGTEGLKLASFDQLKTLSEKYSVARACISLRVDEVLGLGWEICLTKEAAKAYQGDHHANREAGEKIGALTKFFKRPDPDYLTFNSFLAAALEEIFVYDALALIMRPKFGEQFGMGGRGLLGSELDSLRLVSGPTIRPLLDLHGGHPAPPNPAFQQFLYGVPRSDYPTLISGTDLDDSALSGAEYNAFSMDVMRYEPLWNRRETPYGFPPIERALLPIISGLQKQEYQLDYFTEGSVPAVYISPGDANITATQVKELQDALNGIAGDTAFHMKVVVLPPGSKVEPQRPVDLSDGFDQLVMTQVCMAFDVQPIELGILPNIGSGGAQGASASAIRLGSQEAREIKSRKSTKPLLHYLADIFNYVIQDMCGCGDLQFQFEGLADEEDKQAITELGVQQVQNGIASVDEIRDRLDMAPWGEELTSEPVVFTAQGPIPFSMAPQLIMAAQQGGQQGSGGGNNRTQGTNSGQRTSSSRSTSKQPAVRAGGQTKPNGCLAMETRVVTASGIKPIGELVGPQRLLTDKGWVDAEVREFGVQELRRVSFTKAGVQRVVFATPDHRWYLGDNSVKTTDELSYGDDIGFVNELNFIHGRFAGMHELPSVLRRGRIPMAKEERLKTSAMSVVHPEAHGQMVRGLRPTIGSEIPPVGVQKSATLRPDSARVREDAVGPRRQMLSLSSGGIGGDSRDTLATVGGSLSSVQSHSGSAVQQLQPKSGVGGAHGDETSSGVPGWVVVSVEATSRIEKVYCGVVRELHRFVLDGGILTGNSHPAPVSPHRESLTPAHSAASGAVQSSTPRTGGTPSRSSVAGSRKKAVEAELGALKRHIRKGRLISSWVPEHVTEGMLARIAEDVAKGVLLDIAVDRALDLSAYEDLIVRRNVDIPDYNEEWLHKDDLSEPPMWPGWGHDLAIVSTYKGLVADAFKDADITASQLRQKAASGQMFVSGPTLRGLISDGVHDTFMEVLKPLWAEAYSAGYASAKFLVTGEEPDFGMLKHGPNMQNFVETEGAHWLDQISRTGLKDVSARIPMIARTEVARAMNAGAIQAYRDNNVQYKHLLIAPDDTCDICKAAEEEGDIPLDAIFPSGGLGGPLHVQCRCIPAPAGIDLVPPQAKTIKGESWQEDDHTLAWLLLRARGEDGKYRFLLQQRDDGTWGMPGGKAHVGEDPWRAALRETTEEIGDLPGLTLTRNFNHVEDDGVTRVFLYLCDTNYFRPGLNGSTPEETRGTGWFRRKEIDDLNLAPKFREDWFESVNLREHVTKHQIVTENGEQLVVSDPGQPLYPAGARWPYPHRADGAEEPDHGTAETPETTPDFGSRTNPRVYEGDDTDSFPKRRTRNQGPKSQVQQRGKLPSDTDGGVESGLSSPEAGTGVPPGGRKAAAIPVVGMKPPAAPKPGNPRSTPPVVNDPGDAVEHWDDQAESDVVVPVKSARLTPGEQQDIDLANPSKPGGPADYSDPNPVDPDTVYIQMAKNFPPAAIEWVKRARWMGPVNIPWSRIDTDDVAGWAASHQPDRVKEFERSIQAHRGHIAPSIMVQNTGTPKAFIVDGHHRALAHKNLGQPVLAYVANIDPKDRQAAEETHSSQLHSGSDPKNQ
jgi:8-oxo-dGTP pyrophosphatase MutT (NUDIX family)